MRVLKLPAALLLCFFLTPLSVPAQDGTIQISGSVLQKAGYLAFREGIPRAAVRDWFFETSATLRIGLDGETTRFHSVLPAWYDMTGNTWTLSLYEAWFEWKPVQFFGLRAGRVPVAYGSCIAFSPANSLSAQDPFDVRANATGYDGLFMELAPLSAVAEEPSEVALALDGAFLLPRQSAASVLPDLEEGSAHGRIAVLLPEAGILGQTELGVSGDFRRLGGTAPNGEIPAAGGAWLSMDIAGFVFGAEGTLRTPGYAVLSVPGGTVPASGVGSTPETGFAVSMNRRFDDVFSLLEAARLPGQEYWKAFAKLSYARDDAELSLMGILDFQTYSARTSIETAWNAGDSMTFRAWGTWNYLPELWNPALPNALAAGISLEVFF